MASNVAWNHNVPSGNSAVKLGDDDIRSAWTSLTSILSDEHGMGSNFDGTAEERGYHTPNASRVSFGGAGTVKTTVGSNQSGLLFFHHSNGYVYAYPDVSGSIVSYTVGGHRTVHSALPSAKSTNYLSAFTIAPGSAVSMPQAFESKPVVTISVETTNAVDFIGSVVSLDFQSIHVQTVREDGGIAGDEEVVHVMAFGTLASP